MGRFRGVKRWLALATALCCCLSLAYCLSLSSSDAQSATQFQFNVITNAPTAAPLGPSDWVPAVQGDALKKIAGYNIGGSIGKGDGVTDDIARINAAITSAIAAGSHGVSLTPGSIYKVSKSGVGSDGTAVSIIISGAANGFVFDCQGSTLSFSGSTPSTYAHVIRVENSNRVTVKNCAIDWSALPYTQATLSAINATTADFQIDGSYPIAWTSVQQIEEFTPSTVPGVPAKWVNVIFDWTGGNRTVTTLGGGLYRVDFSGGSDPAKLALLTVAHSYLLTSQNYGADALNTNNVNDLVLDNFRCYASGGNCIATWGGTGIVVKNGSGPRLLPNSTRWRSVDASGVLSGFARGAVTIDGLYDESGGDDAVDIFGLMYTVNAITDTQHYVLNGVLAPGYAPLAGDVLQFKDTTGTVQGTATITSVVTGGSTHTIVSSAAPAAFATTWVVSDVSAIPSEFIMRNSQVRYVRGRGVLTQAQKNLIKNNRFDRLTDASIMFYSDKALYPQGPVPKNITIAGNVSENNNTIGSPADIAIFAFSLDGLSDAPAGTISGVTITGNTCRNAQDMCIFVDGASNVSISGNTFDNWATAANGSAWHGLGANAIGLYNVSGLKLGQNNYLTAGSKFAALGTTGPFKPAQLGQGLRRVTAPHGKPPRLHHCCAESGGKARAPLAARRTATSQ
jgi:hypothetical protein